MERLLVRLGVVTTLLAELCFFVLPRFRSASPTPSWLSERQEAERRYNVRPSPENKAALERPFDSGGRPVNWETWLGLGSGLLAFNGALAVVYFRYGRAHGCRRREE